MLANDYPRFAVSSQETGGMAVTVALCHFQRYFGFKGCPNPDGQREAGQGPKADKLVLILSVYKRSGAILLVP